MSMSSPSGGSRTSMSEINVTPLVDVMLVLLIIFMVTAPMMHQGIDVDLPETAGAGKATTEDPFLVVIEKTGRVRFGDATIPMADIRKKISAIFSTRKNKEVYIQADKKVEYGIVASAMSEIRAAGVRQMSLVTIPKEQ